MWRGEHLDKRAKAFGTFYESNHWQRSPQCAGHGRNTLRSLCFGQHDSSNIGCRQGSKIIGMPGRASSIDPKNDRNAADIMPACGLAGRFFRLRCYCIFEVNDDRISARGRSLSEKVGPVTRYEKRCNRHYKWLVQSEPPPNSERTLSVSAPNAGTRSSGPIWGAGPARAG